MTLAARVAHLVIAEAVNTRYDHRLSESLFRALKRLWDRPYRQALQTGSACAG